MKWLDNLLGIPSPKVEEDMRAIEDLRTSFIKVQMRTERLERELKRINQEYRRKKDSGNFVN